MFDINLITRTDTGGYDQLVNFLVEDGWSMKPDFAFEKGNIRIRFETLAMCERRTKGGVTREVLATVQRVLNAEAPKDAEDIRRGVELVEESNA